MWRMLGFEKACADAPERTGPTDERMTDVTTKAESEQKTVQAYDSSTVRTHCLRQKRRRKCVKLPFLLHWHHVGLL